MTADKKIAIKNIREFEKELHGSEIRKYRAGQITFGVLTGASLAAYIVSKATTPLLHLEELPINGYFEESLYWIKEEFIPKLRGVPGLWKTIAPENTQEGVIAGLTALFASASIWQRHKKVKEKREMRKETKEEIKKLGA